MAWLAVDKDKTEKIFSSRPIRRNESNSELSLGDKVKRLVRSAYSKNEYKKWAAYWSTDEFDPLPEGGIILPKGSIEKLIGRKLTWKNEPVELKE